MARIYVSSTFNDLKDCRDAAIKLLRRMRHNLVAMEDYTAEDQWPAVKCLADVAACDLYVGLFAWRYGYIPTENNPDQLSITEMEYRQAITLKKHCLIFLLKEDAPWPRPFMDRNPDRIEDFRNRLGNTHVCDFFTSAQDIAGLVSTAVANWVRTQEMSSQSGHIAFDFTVYIDSVYKHYQRVDLEGLTPPQREEYLQLQLGNIFVEQSVREDTPPVEISKDAWERIIRDREMLVEDAPDRNWSLGDRKEMESFARTRDEYFQKPRRPVLDVLTDPRHRHVVVLGHPGTGKSTLSRYVLLSLIDSAGDEKLHGAMDGWVPLLIELRSYASLRADHRCDTFLEFLGYLGKTEGWQLREDALRQYLQSDGRAIVIFDGLDEIFDPKDRELFTRRIAAFANEYPKTRIVVTSRIIGYHRKILTDAGFDHFTLQDMDEDQVKTFVDRWYSLALDDRPDDVRERSDRILRAFNDSPSIRQLAGNPMLLTIMAIIGKHQELPRERWKLYDYAAGVLVEHWDVNKRLRGQHIKADHIGEEEKKEMLRRLAFKMQRGYGGLAGNYIHRDELEAEFEDYLKERFNSPPADARIVVRWITTQFRERNFILSFYGANLHGFVHRAFLEFFCASAFVLKFEKTKEMTFPELIEVYSKYWKDKAWHEVLRLICGMIAPRFAGTIIDYLTNHVEFDVAEQLQPWEEYMAKRGNITLAIQCIGEVSNLNVIADPARHLLQKLCSLFDHGMEHGSEHIYGLFKQNITPTLETIGSSWPNREDLAKWLRQRQPLRKSFYGSLFTDFVGSIGKGQNEVHLALLEYAADEEGNKRVLAPEVLAKYWTDDPRTLPLLHNLATNDTSNDVRHSAIDALIGSFLHDSQTLLLLRSVLFDDRPHTPHYNALRAIVEHFCDDPETAPLLRHLAHKNSDEFIRSDALKALINHFSHDPENESLLRNLALNDTVIDIRTYAIRALAKHFHESQQTFELICKLANQSEPDDVRRIAVMALAEHLRLMPETKTLLCHYAADDPSMDVRADAASALVERFSQDPVVLSIVHKLAVEDKEEAVRLRIAGALARNIQEDPHTLSTLLYQATNDVSAHVRRSALWYAARNFREDARTLKVIRARAVDDESPSPTAPNNQLHVRRTAIWAIARHWPLHPDTLPLLRERAQNDPTPWLREFAMELAEELKDWNRAGVEIAAAGDEEGVVRS